MTGHRMQYHAVARRAWGCQVRYAAACSCGWATGWQPHRKDVVDRTAAHVHQERPRTAAERTMQ